MLDIINKIIKAEPWFDFEIESYDGRKLILIGGVSTITPSYRIVFEDCNFLQIKCNWKVDKDSKVEPFVQLEGLEEIEINKKNNIESGYKMIQINNEDVKLNGYFYIACKFVYFYSLGESDLTKDKSYQKI